MRQGRVNFRSGLAQAARLVTEVLICGHRSESHPPGVLDIREELLGARKVTSGHAVRSAGVRPLSDDVADRSGYVRRPCRRKRRLHHGDNPDVVVQSALASAGSTHVPRTVGYVVGEWPDTSAPDGMARGHLACAQEFFPDVEDAWRVALAAVAADEDFSDQARSLGQTTAEVHATLAHAMTTATATDEDVAALSRSMRAWSL